MKSRNAVIFFGTIVAGCVATVPLAPGADQVKITKEASDVAACTPVGNLDNSIQVDLNKNFEKAQISNQAVGLGGNTVFETTFGGKVSGIVYRCGSGATRSQ